MHPFLIFVIHFTFGIGLFSITNWIGKHSYSIGYMQISIFVKSETAPAFNFLFRVLSPVVYIVIISAVLYKIGLDILVKNIFLVTFYYIAFRIIFNILTNRIKLLNWRRLGIQTVCMSVVSWLVYDSIIKHKRNILPDLTTISNELWIIILLFIFQVLNNLTFSSEDTEKRKNNYLTNRYNLFKKKYGPLIDGITQNNRLKALTYSTMIYEDFNRPKAVRIVENVRFQLKKKPMTLGVMQVKSDTLIDDYGSVMQGVTKLKNDLQEIISKKEVPMDDQNRDWYILPKLIERFNGGKSYNSEITELFSIIWDKHYGGSANEMHFDTN